MSPENPTSEPDAPRAVLSIGQTYQAWSGPEAEASLTLPHAGGICRLPYIQSSRNLRVSAAFAGEGAGPVALTLRGPGAPRETTLTPELPGIVFHKLQPGEYELDLAWDGRHARLRRIGIGSVLAALGDSITEGYHGRAFMRDPACLTAGLFPPASVSADGRNFPRFAPTAAVHKPEANCFESWMSRLNGRLAAAWRQPVFIANEGRGGITAAGYLALARTDAGWKERMEILKPDTWLIHLGVNDSRAARPAPAVAADLEALADLLIRSWGARPERIVVARPCYDYWPEAAARLAAYAEAIDALVAQRGLAAGPDFFAAYATERARWYGSDPVHPNEEGMIRMADLWADSLAGLGAR